MVSSPVSSGLEQGTDFFFQWDYTMRHAIVHVRVPAPGQFAIGFEGADEPISRHWHGLMMSARAGSAVVRLIVESGYGNSRRPMIRKTPSVTGRHKRPVRDQRT
jgi:hypothetical protein